MLLYQSQTNREERKETPPPFAHISIPTHISIFIKNYMQLEVMSCERPQA
jgi:hypothetical protein